MSEGFQGGFNHTPLCRETPVYRCSFISLGCESGIICQWCIAWPLIIRCWNAGGVMFLIHQSGEPLPLYIPCMYILHICMYNIYMYVYIPLYACIIYVWDMSPYIYIYMWHMVMHRPPLPRGLLPSPLKKVKFFSYCAILMKFETQHFHMFTNNN